MRDDEAKGKTAPSQPGRGSGGERAQPQSEPGAAGERAAGSEKAPAANPIPAPTLPKGGGAIRDMGEKLSVNPATGTGTFTVPVPLSAGRDGFHPELSLQYTPATGNGAYGIGWDLPLPRITRRTDKGLPRYFDAEDSDRFILSGSEDSVPALLQSGAAWVRDQRSATDESGAACTVLRFRPRVEAAYARIERWTRTSDGDVHWRTLAKDNTTSIFGRSAQARIADPAAPERRVFDWLLEETRDGKGNICTYEYQAEDQQNLDASVGYERPRAVANAYLKRVSYGNRQPGVAGDWLFQLLFDYGEHDANDPVGAPLKLWPGRRDPFSDFRPTFELRTYRLCRRILMLHQMPELGAGWTVVRSTHLGYDENPIASYLIAVTESGWLRRSDGTYETPLALPTLEVEYSRPQIEPTVHTVDATSLAQLPAGADGQHYQLLDLDGEGLPGVVSQQAGALFYSRNDGDGTLGPVAWLGSLPSTIDLTSGAMQQLSDLDGSGASFLVQLGPPQAGYFARDDDGWDQFLAFKSTPNLDWQDDALKYLDLDGDGLADVLKPEGELFRWWPSLGRDGYGAEQQVSQLRDDDAAPYVLWSDRRQAVLLADMNGDGLSEIVRVRNGAVDYWPNRGYGRFGARVAMRAAPRFDSDDAFNPAFLRLADIDGSGSADLIYLQDGVARVWMNQAGNGYGAETAVPFPSPAGSAVTISDFLGKGTACLVWSSPLPADQRRQMRYLDLMSGTKPHLLTVVRNNLGATTTIGYAASTRDYLDDRRAGRPWVTRLPFPVQVVATVQVDEAVTGTRMVTTYRYHHGHYDGVEREFAGFGMVEQEDAEMIEEGSDPPIVYTPPKRTKTWYHTGAFIDAAKISTQFAHEYDADFPQLLPDSVIAEPERPEEAREAVRALRGRMLRQEVYGLDGSALEPHPYVTSEANFEARLLQPRADNRYAVFDVTPRETLTVHSERNPADPRLEHDVTVDVDAFGNVLGALHVAYGRPGAPAASAQARTWVTYRQRDYTTLTSGDDYYRVDLLRDDRGYELSGLPAPAANGVYSRPELLALVSLVNGPPALDIDVSVSVPPTMPARRLYERTRRRYLGDLPADDALLALGLVVATERAALSAAQADLVYQPVESNPAARALLLSDQKYVLDDGLWWATSGQTDYAAALFYQVQRATDPFGNVTTVDYDGYLLKPVTVTSALGTPYQSVVSAQLDYRILAPSLITDVNGNRKRAQLDALGRVVAMWRMGKPSEAVGDDDAHPSTRFAYHLEAVPTYIYTEKREQGFLDDPSNDKIQPSYIYSDGLGREVLTKRQAQPDASGARWMCTGRTIFDNKGHPVQKFEPYFSPTTAFESVFHGVSDLIRYDPLGRRVRTDHPNGAYSRVEMGELSLAGTSWTHQLDAWGQIDYDENDTVGEPGNAWYARFAAGSVDQQDAAAKALAHAGTPTRTLVDALGRVYSTTQDAGFDAGLPRLYSSRFELDVRGKQLAVTDARDVRVVQHQFDMLGQELVADSVDAGRKILLLDVLGARAREWTANGQLIETERDPHRRSRRVWVTEGGRRRLAERTFYGETLSDGADYNLRGQPFRQLDGAGLQANVRYDYQGNPVEALRQLATVYDQAADWPDVADPTTASAPPAIAGLEAESFTTTTAYDALDRVVRVVLPSGTAAGDHVTRPSYNETGQLGGLSIQLAGSATATPLVSAIDYDAKAQRTRIAYGNGVVTVSSYEPDTFRLSTVTSSRSASGDLQALAYVYDPIGNITTISDGAQQTLYVGNSVVAPRMRYTFDALYRLTEARGREHSGQAGGDQTSTPDGVPIPSASDPQAMRLYAERYQYDPVGNFEQMVHAAANGMGVFSNLWTRTYTTDSASNRLLSSQFGNGIITPTTYQHDAAGNLTAMTSAPLPSLSWDYRSRLSHAVSSRGDTYCTYDANGRRVRKVLVPAAGRIKERIYLGTYEIYRERSGATVALERRTLELDDEKRRVALIDLRTVGSDASPARLIRYQLDNHLHSALLELDDTAQLLSYEEYHPYGTSAYRATASALAASPKRYAYTSKERDEETGLHYHGARYYASWLGRWLSTDPDGFVGGTNLYCYVRCNPIMLHDPTGRQPAPAIDPVVVRTAQSALARAAARWGTAQVIEGGGVAALAPEAAAVPAVGLGTVASVAVAGLAFVGALALATQQWMQRSGSLARYGNPYGVPRDDIAFPVLRAVRENRSPIEVVGPDPVPPPQPAPDPAEDPERRRQRERETVNLDTTALVAASSLRDPWITVGLNAFLQNRNLVATQTAVREFLTGNIRSAGPTEQVLAAALLARVTVVPDNPSPRVAALRESQRVGANDKLVFGTGDQMRIRTVSADANFVRGAAAQGVILSVVMHPSNPFSGQ